MADELETLDPQAPQAAETVEVQQPDANAEAELDQRLAADEAKGDGRRLPMHIRSLKETNPKAYREDSTRFFRDLETQERLKGHGFAGTKDLDTLMTWLGEKGGREAIEQQFADLNSRAERLSSIEDRIANGKGSEVVSEFFNANPEAVPELGMAAMQNWAQVSPETYTAALNGAVSQVVASSGVMDSFRTYANMERLAQSDPRAADLLPGLAQTALAEVYQAITGLTKAQPTPPQPQQGQRGNSKLDQREQALTQREQQAFQSDALGAATSFRTDTAKSEIEAYAGRKLTDADSEDLSMAMQLIHAEVEKRVLSDQKYMDSVKGLLAKRDKDGFMRLVKSREAQYIKDIAPKVAKRFFSNQPVKAAPKVEAQRQRQEIATPPPANVDPKAAYLSQVFGR